MVINKKLLINIIITSAIALILLGSFVIFCSKSIINNILLTKTKEQLILIRDFKKQQLEKFFFDLKKHIEFLSNESLIKNSFQEFKTAFDQLLETNNPTLEYQPQNTVNLKIAQHYNNMLKQYKEYSNAKDKIDFSVFLQNLNPYSILLQTKYMTDQVESHENTKNLDAYANIHDKYHNEFQKIMAEYQYHDLYLVDLNGNVIYSFKKNIDFATSLATGAFSNTDLSNVFNAAKYTNSNENNVILSNFSEYLPDYQEPVLFVANKIPNFGVLIASIGLSSINSILKLPEKTTNTSIYLIDQDLHLINNNDFGKSINTMAAREAVRGKKGLIEAPGINKTAALSSFTPIEDKGLHIIIESNKNLILKSLSKSITNMLLFTTITIPILLFFLYTIYCLFIEKADNKLHKLSTFMQVVLTKKDLTSRINLNNTDANGIANILNNMLSWFQNTLDQVAFKIKQFVNKYNNLFANITNLSENIITEQSLIECAKISTNNLMKNSEQLQANLEQHFNTIENHKKTCLALNNINCNFNQKQSINNLTSAVEYILSICNLADMLSLHLSLEASKHGNDNNFLLLSKEIKKMVANLKSRLIQIKDSFDSYILEHDTIRNFVTEFSEKLKPVTDNLELLFEQQNLLLTSANNNQAISNTLQNHLLELETKYNEISQKLVTLVEDNNKLNADLQIDDYYPFKIADNTAT